MTRLSDIRRTLLLVFIFILTVNRVDANTHTFSNLPAIEKITIGNTEIIALLDGFFEVQQEWFNLPKKTKKAYLKAAHQMTNQSIKTQITAYFIKFPNRNVLIDAGGGLVFGKNSGNIAV